MPEKMYLTHNLTALVSTISNVECIDIHGFDLTQILTSISFFNYVTKAMCFHRYNFYGLISPNAISTFSSSGLYLANKNILLKIQSIFVSWLDTNLSFFLKKRNMVSTNGFSLRKGGLATPAGLALC